MVVEVGKIQFSNKKDFVLIGGLNVLEDFNLTLYTAKYFKETCNKLNINNKYNNLPYIMAEVFLILVQDFGIGILKLSKYC